MFGLKSGKAGDAALWQLLGYMSFVALQTEIDGNVRGILVALDFEQIAAFAVKDIPNVKFCKYQLSFSFENIT